MREVPVADVVNSPLLNIAFSALDTDNSFEAATDCLCAIFRETRDVDECLRSIQVLLPRVVALQPRIAQAEQQEDTETFKGLTRIFAEAGEAWVVLIARDPLVFRPLVEAVLECAARDIDRDAIALTFIFWYELKLYLILERYIEARMQYMDVYSKLVDVMLKQLEFPTPDNADTVDPFDGDKEAEEKYREFRHHMGDVLKDCCEIMGVTECLSKVLERIKAWMGSYAGLATTASVPHWQQLEAPLFSMRALGRMVDKDEDIILPQIMPLIVQIPHHEKLRFATIMVIGRYTEWTSNHPELLESQFTYIVSSFGTDSKEIVRAAAMAMKYFCTDCKYLLGGQVVQLQSFYNQTLEKLPVVSQEELTEGVASVVAVQPPAQILDYMKLYCDPLMTRLMTLANQANDENGKLAVAGKSLRLSSQFELTSITRPRAVNHYLHPDRQAIRRAWPRESSSQVLPGDLPYLVNHYGELHDLHPDLRTNLPQLAIYGYFLPYSHCTPPWGDGRQACVWICYLEAGMLPLGYRCHSARVL